MGNASPEQEKTAPKVPTTRSGREGTGRGRAQSSIQHLKPSSSTDSNTRSSQLINSLARPELETPPLPGTSVAVPSSPLSSPATQSTENTEGQRKRNKRSYVSLEYIEAEKRRFRKENRH